jgi:hypothetical protein
MNTAVGSSARYCFRYWRSSIDCVESTNCGAHTEGYFLTNPFVVGERKLLRLDKEDPKSEIVPSQRRLNSGTPENLSTTKTSRRDAPHGEVGDEPICADSEEKTFQEIFVHRGADPLHMENAGGKQRETSKGSTTEFDAITRCISQRWVLAFSVLARQSMRYVFSGNCG